MPRKKFTCTSSTNLFVKAAERQQQPVDLSLNDLPNTDNLSASSVREKIKIFTKNPLFATSTQSNKSGNLNRVKKVFNPPVNNPQHQQVKPRPLSQVIVENRHHKLGTTDVNCSSSINNNNCTSNVSKFNDTVKPPQQQSHKHAIMNQIDLKAPDTREIGRSSLEEATNETEKTFKSVKEKIAYFSSKLYLEKSGQRQQVKSDKPTGVVKEGKHMLQKGGDKKPLPEAASNCLIETKPKLSPVNNNNNNKYFTETSSSSSSVHYASFHNLNNFNVIYNQVSQQQQHSVKYADSGCESKLVSESSTKKVSWKSNINLNGKKCIDLKMIDGSENKISSLIENLETKWKQRGLNN